MLDLEVMSVEELYDYKEHIYMLLMTENSYTNYNRLIETLNAISIEIKRRRG